MKKMENILLVPILVLAVFMALPRSFTLGIHLLDVYYVLSNTAIALTPLILILLVFTCYKALRRRGQAMPSRLVGVHAGLTMLLMIILVIGWWSMPALGKDIEAGRLIGMQLYISLLKRGLFFLVAVQLFFLAFCVVQLFRPALPR